MRPKVFIRNALCMYFGMFPAVVGNLHSDLPLKTLGRNLSENL